MRKNGVWGVAAATLLLFAGVSLAGGGSSSSSENGVPTTPFPPSNIADLANLLGSYSSGILIVPSSAEAEATNGLIRNSIDFAGSSTDLQAATSIYTNYSIANIAPNSDNQTLIFSGFTNSVGQDLFEGGSVFDAWGGRVTLAAFGAMEEDESAGTTLNKQDFMQLRAGYGRNVGKNGWIGGILNMATFDGETTFGETERTDLVGEVGYRHGFGGLDDPKSVLDLRARFSAGSDEYGEAGFDTWETGRAGLGLDARYTVIRDRVEFGGWGAFETRDGEFDDNNIDLGGTPYTVLNDDITSDYVGLGGYVQFKVSDQFHFYAGNNYQKSSDEIDLRLDDGVGITSLMGEFDADGCTLFTGGRIVANDSLSFFGGLSYLVDGTDDGTNEFQNRDTQLNFGLAYNRDNFRLEAAVFGAGSKDDPVDGNEVSLDTFVLTGAFSF